MTPEDRDKFREEIKKELGQALTKLQDEICKIIYKAFNQSSLQDVYAAKDWFLEILSRGNITAHIVIERPQLPFSTFPKGTGEPRLLVRMSDKVAAECRDFLSSLDIGITIEDKEWLRKEGIDLGGN